MSWSTSVAAVALAALRRRFTSGGEAFPASAERGSASAKGRLLSGWPPLDKVFGGAGLPLHASHEVSAESPDDSAAMGFGLGLLARLLAEQPAGTAMFVQTAAAGAEGGLLYGPGLHAYGVDPDRLLMVHVRDESEALRVVDEALRSRAVAGVLAELGKPQKLDLSATRRFNLAAERAGAPAFLVTSEPAGTSAAVTRWRVAASPSTGAGGLVGSPAFRLELTRNRFGPLGAWTLAWDVHEHVFRPVAAGPVPLARPVPDRSPAADEPDREAAGRRRQTG